MEQGEIIIRGTTPNILLKFADGLPSTIDKIRIYFLQGNDVLIEKTENDVYITEYNDVISVVLSQEETQSLSTKKLLEMRARIKMPGGVVFGTRPVFLQVICGDNAGEEVL